MSIITCARCSKHIDTDISAESVHTHLEWDYCTACWEKMQEEWKASCSHHRAEQRGDEWQCPDCMIAWPTTKLAGEIQTPRRILKWYPLHMRPQN